MLAAQHANLAVAGFAFPTYGIATLAANGSLDFLPADFVDSVASLRDPYTLFVLTIIATAFALLPDFDEPNSTVSRKFGFLGRGLSHVFRKVVGGHREGSHTLVFALVCGAIGIGLQLFGDGVAQVAVGIIFVVSISLIIRLILPFGFGNVIYGVAVVGAIVLAFLNGINDALPLFGLGFAMFAGVNLHCLGDALTPSRVKWLAPMYRGAIGVNINGKTGGTIELFVMGPILALASAAALFIFFLNPVLVHFGIVIF